jgi:hypothetical protein
MSDERVYFISIYDSLNNIGVSDLLAKAKACEISYKDRCKIYVLTTPEVE